MKNNSSFVMTFLLIRFQQTNTQRETSQVGRYNRRFDTAAQSRLWRISKKSKTTGPTFDTPVLENLPKKYSNKSHITNQKNFSSQSNSTRCWNGTHFND